MAGCPPLALALQHLREPTSLVGGAVRDALLGLPPGPDLDLVVEGDARALARRLGRALGVRAAEHERFGTAELTLPDGTALDLVQARRERYAHPGALPEVEPGTLLDDLVRRDFTVNAMAFRLSGPEAGAIVDPRGGRSDLHAGVLRVMRPDAFDEDPSRLVRAARYAARLGFVLDPATEAAARAAAPALDPASARVAEGELQRLAGEADAAPAAGLLADWGVDWIVAAPPPALAALDAAAAEPGAPAVERWAMRLGLLVAPARIADLAVAGWARAVAAEVVAGGALAERLASAALPSEIDAILRTTPPATAIAARALGAEAVGRWWREWRDVEVGVSGADLVAAGVAPGPAIGRALAAVRAAVLNGTVLGREERLAMALREAGA